jgi:hypothetical protein
VLDDAAARRVNETALAVPELLAEHQQFARAPFDVTWIEPGLHPPNAHSRRGLKEGGLTRSLMSFIMRKGMPYGDQS